MFNATRDTPTVTWLRFELFGTDKKTNSALHQVTCLLVRVAVSG
jgi:hypothetical protein